MLKILRNLVAMMAVLAFSTFAQAQSIRPQQGGTGCSSPATALPTADVSTGTLCTITTGSAAGVCTTGGSAVVTCRYNGATWDAVTTEDIDSTGGGASGSLMQLFHGPANLSLSSTGVTDFQWEDNNEVSFGSDFNWCGDGAGACSTGVDADIRYTGTTGKVLCATLNVLTDVWTGNHRTSTILRFELNGTPVSGGTALYRRGTGEEPRSGAYFRNCFVVDNDDLISATHDRDGTGSEEFLLDPVQTYIILEVMN